MKKRADTVGLACEAIHRMFQKEQTELVAQVSDFLESAFF
jgi:DnaJ family protein C protein 13